MVVNGAESVSPSNDRPLHRAVRALRFRAGAMAPGLRAGRELGRARLSAGRPRRRSSTVSIADALARDGIARPAPRIQILRRSSSSPAAGRSRATRSASSTIAGSELPERREGRLEFKGPSATKGYFRNEEKTRRLFDGDVARQRRPAYVAEGDIYITGRVKDMIIRAGRNVYPQELEESSASYRGRRQGLRGGLRQPRRRARAPSGSSSWPRRA